MDKIVPEGRKLQLGPQIEAAPLYAESRLLCLGEREMIEVGGGRAGPHESGWVKAGYNLEDVESLRQQLLRQNDYGSVQRAMRQAGVSVDRAILHVVKRYNFDSKGIGFRYPNYAAWRRLVTGKGIINDAAYVVHETAEVKELQRIELQTGFDFMGKNFETLPSRQQRQWKYDFDRYYKLSHSKALEAEYEFLAEEVNSYIKDPKLKISILQAAAIDPTRYVSGAKETEAAKHMFVDGVIMREHQHYNAWRRRANELIRLSKGVQRKLGVSRKEMRVDDLITMVKNQLIK